MKPFSSDDSCGKMREHPDKRYRDEMFMRRMQRFAQHHPQHRRKYRLPILFFGLVFGFIMLLVVGAAITLMIQIMQIPRHPHMMDDGPAIFIPFLVFLVIIAALVMVGRWSRRRFSRPLEKILNAADRISEGDLTTRIEGIGNGPFLQVEYAFNHMVEELERGDQLRREQTADIAHELNTPIHIIRGYLEGINDGIYEADQEMIDLLMEETSLLSRLVDDLRLLSLADAGRLPIHPEILNLKEVIEDIEVSFKGHAADEQIDFSIQAQEEVWIQVDPSHIYRIINNLVSNAISYTPQGGKVSLSAKNVGQQAVLVIADTGQGMSPEDQLHAFDRFWRKDKSRQRTDGGGYGLGLSIVQQLVLSNGGEIHLESKLEQGTTFTLKFPLAENSN